VGRGSGKDIVNVPFDVEVKARAGFQPLAYLKQLKARTSSSGELGFGVIRLNGQGEDASEYACITHGFDSRPVVPCQLCNAPMVKEFTASAVHFKGKGFYSTDK
jgi:hypothetical protein